MPWPGRGPIGKRLSRNKRSAASNSWASLKAGVGAELVAIVVSASMLVLSVFMLVRSAEVGMAMAVAPLIAPEMLHAVGAPMLVEVLAAMRIFAAISVVAIVVIIDVAPEAAVTMEPWPSTDEDAAREPLGTVIAVGGAIIRGVIEVAVGALRRRSYLHRDLSLCILR